MKTKECLSWHKIRLSIIIPVYNVEKYIGSTLGSLVEQGNYLDDCEVIIINDGTPDKSMDIVEDYQAKINHLQIINQSNQGLSCARNVGLKQANGDYVWFVDSDDMLTNDALKKLSDLLANCDCDVLAFDMIKVDEITKIEKTEPVLFKSRQLYGKICQGVELWRKIHICPAQRFVFKRIFLQENNLEFCPSIIHEDEELFPRIIAKADSVICYPDAIYKYLVRASGSIMSAFNMRSVESSMIILDNFRKYAPLEKNKKKKDIFHDASFKVIYAILKKDMGLHNELEAFRKTHKASLKKRAFNSYIKTLVSFNSLGKTYKLIKILIV